jgi:hydroxymethylglutaryl-CoA lyase
MSSDRVQIVEVGPRDGLQAEPSTLATAVKVELIHRLMDAGLRRIEATSFVSPTAVPQLADAEDVLDQISRRDGVEISALVPNMRGLERALAAKVDRIAVFTSASETFAQRNIRCTIDESVARFEPVVDAARASGILVRGYVSMAWHCPYEGVVAPGSVIAVARSLDAIGCDEIALADTVGLATPEEVRALLSRVADEVPVERVAVHLHDTSGRAVANVEAAVEVGVRVFDGAVGGLGGCPFAPGSPGNLDTEALVDALTRLGFETGVDLVVLRSAVETVQPLAGRAA